MFLKFCVENGIDPFPVRECDLMMFCAEQVRLDHAVSTAKSYLTAIYSFNMRLGFEPYHKEFRALPNLVQAMKRKLGLGKRRERLPITVDVLVAFRNCMDMSRADHAMLWAMFTTAFLGVLRSGELAPKSLTVTQAVPRIASIAFTGSGRDEYMSFKLVVSKSDPFRRTVTVHIGKTGHTVCAVAAMKHWLSFRGKAACDDYLFVHADGQPFLYNDLLFIIKSLATIAGVPSPEKYSGHSFRSGGATALANAGVPLYRIKLMGRWLSDAYELYVRTEPTTLAACARVMVTGKET